MKRERRLKWAVLAMLWLFTCTTAWPQQPVDAVDPFAAEAAEQVLKIYELRNSDAREMSKLLMELLREEARISVDMRTNSLVVMARPVQHKIVTAVMALDESKRAASEQQQEAATRPQAAFKVFTLVNVSAQESAKVLTNLFPNGQIRVAADAQTNTVILSADAEEQLDVAEALLIRLDEAAGGAEKKGPAVRTHSFSFKHLKANELHQRLQQVRSGLISFQIMNNQVTVTGPQNALDEVENLLRELDQPAAPSSSMRVRIIWLLAASQDDPSLKSLPAPPNDLKPVLEELTDLGIKEPRLATQLVLYGVVGSQKLQLNGNISDPFPSQVDVTGELLDSSSTSPSLKLHIGIAGGSGSRPGWGGPMGTLNTQITTPPGHFVVLGAMPMNALTSVFVVQVTPLATESDAEEAAAQKLKTEAEKALPPKAAPKR